MATSNPLNRFEAHPVRTIGIILLAFLLLLFAAAELTLRRMGFGNPVVYQTDPLYAYRPRPNQDVRRQRGARIRINNLGLRADSDWDADISRKVLFLGNSVTYGGSYVSNADLFAIRAVPTSTGWMSASGGVNGWGVENIHGLVVGHDFRPARVVVTVLIDDDFDRGLAQRFPFFRTRKPALALIEVLPHVKMRMQARINALSPGKKRAVARAQWSSESTRVERAVRKLVEIDQHLKRNGHLHIIYHSPYRRNLVGAAPPDPIVAAALARSGLWVEKLAERPELRSLTRDQVDRLYHDGIHLTVAGHALWAEIMQRDLLALGLGVRRIATTDAARPPPPEVFPP